jgi:site-specific recombinase XerD
MSIGFYLDRDSVYAIYRIQKHGKRINLTYYPGIKIENENDWRKDKQRTRDEESNKRLVNIEKAINDLVDSVDPFQLTNETFAQGINQMLYGKPQTKTSFFDYAEEFVKQARQNKGHEFANSFRTVLNKLREFDPNLTFERIDKKFYRDFVTWLQGKGFSANYTGSMIRDLKRILNKATEDEINTSSTFESFKVMAEDVFNIYLTEEEIERIYNVQITEKIIIELQKENKRKQLQKQMKAVGDQVDVLITKANINRQIEALHRARKLFVVGCWTGLRVENYLSIDPELQFDLEKGFIHAIANKNGPKLKIPMHKLVRQIIERDGFPPTISQQKFNKQIKIIGQIAQINENVIFSRTEGGKRVEYSQPKYELITTHTARRSFASNLLSRGIPKQFIMAVTGHTTEKSFNKYTQAIQKDIMTEKLAEYDIWK